MSVAQLLSASADSSSLTHGIHDLVQFAPITTRYFIVTEGLSETVFNTNKCYETRKFVVDYSLSPPNKVVYFSFPKTNIRTLSFIYRAVIVETAAVLNILSLTKFRPSNVIAGKTKIFEKFLCVWSLSPQKQQIR